MTYAQTPAERAALARTVADGMVRRLRAASATERLIEAQRDDIMRSSIVAANVNAVRRPPAGHDAAGLAFADAMLAVSGRLALITVAEARALARKAMSGPVKPPSASYVVREPNDSVTLVTFGRRLGMRRAWRYLTSDQMREIDAAFVVAFLDEAPA